jgi:flagellar hook-length control protein FliK
MSTAPIVSSKISAVRPDADFSRNLQQGADVPQFDQVLNLVQPKVAQEAVKAYESNSQDKTKVDESSSKQNLDDKKVSQDDKERAVSQADDPRQTAETGQANSGQLNQVDTENQKAKILKMVNQLSQDDLLSIIEWRGDLGLQAGALDTNLNIDQLPKAKGVSTSDMMALLNGFKQLEIPTDQLPQLDGPQVANWLEAQWANAKMNVAGRQMMVGQFMPDMSQQQNMTANQNAMMSMEAVARPSEVMPALSLLKLSQSQKNGLLRQVAQGYKNQRGGTQSVNIRLHPEELGAVRLKVEIQGQDVRLFFSAENAAVTDLISQNLDELRAMLLEKDFNLSETGLFQDQLDQGEGHEQAEEGEDYGNDDRPNLQKRPKNGPRLSPLPGRFRATV